MNPAQRMWAEEFLQVFWFNSLQGRMQRESWETRKQTISVIWIWGDTELNYKDRDLSKKTGVWS
jgi:hypothetical protein